MIEEQSSIPGNGKRIFPPHASTSALRPRTTGTGDFPLSLNRLEREAVLPRRGLKYVQLYLLSLLLFMAWCLTF